MNIFEEIVKIYGDDNEEWDEETQKNWDEKMSDTAMHHIHDDENRPE